MSNAPLMPKATAVWLVENTALTFDQIADFCKLHPLEVKGIADGEVAAGIKGQDPMTSNQLTREEIARGERDPNYRLKLAEPKVKIAVAKVKKGPRYTPVSRRQDRPNAILWLVKNHPELKDAQIMRLVGTTKSTIASIRERTHWNAQQLSPMDPVMLGLCSQIDLDFEVAARLQGQARRGRERRDAAARRDHHRAGGARPAPRGRVLVDPGLEAGGARGKARRRQRLRQAQGHQAEGLTGRSPRRAAASRGCRRSLTRRAGEVSFCLIAGEPRRW